jgi:hypothetical protein
MISMGSIGEGRALAHLAPATFDMGDELHAACINSMPCLSPAGSPSVLGELLGDTRTPSEGNALTEATSSKALLPPRSIYLPCSPQLAAAGVCGMVHARKYQDPQALTREQMRRLYGVQC